MLKLGIGWLVFFVQMLQIYCSYNSSAPGIKEVAGQSPNSINRPSVDHGVMTQPGMAALAFAAFIVAFTFIGWLIKRCCCKRTESATMVALRSQMQAQWGQQNTNNVYSSRALCPQVWLTPPPPYPGQPGDTTLMVSPLPRYSQLYDENGVERLPASDA